LEETTDDIPGFVNLASKLETRKSKFGARNRVSDAGFRISSFEIRGMNFDEQLKEAA